MWPRAGGPARPSPHWGPSGFSILQFSTPHPRHDPSLKKAVASQQGRDTVLPLQLLGLAAPSAHLAERQRPPETGRRLFEDS